MSQILVLQFQTHSSHLYTKSIILAFSQLQFNFFHLTLYCLLYEPLH